MGLYVGDSDNLVLMLGDTEVSAAYIGDTQVYPMSPFAVSPSRMSLNNVQLTANLRIKSPEAWTITDNSGGWLSFSANSGTAGVTVVTVTATTATADRTATISVTTANYSKNISVEQTYLDYENSRYFHIHNVSNQTGTLSFKRNTGGIVDLDWSTDLVTWTAVPMVNNPWTTIPADGYLFFRGNNGWLCGMEIYMDVDHTFGGNVLSMVDSTNFDSLTSVPSGGMHTLAKGDTHLVSAKNMDWGPACTTVPNGWMLYQTFYGCTALTEGPDMRSFTNIGSSDPCDGFFEGCRSLTKVIAPSVQGSWPYDSFTGWLNNVAATGIVVMDPNTTNVPQGSSGIPSGWTRVDSYYSVTLDATNGNAMDYATSDGRSGSVTAGNTETVRLDYPQTLSITTGGATYHLYVNSDDQGNGPSYTLDYLDLSNGDTLTVVHTSEPS